MLQGSFTASLLNLLSFCSRPMNNQHCLNMEYFWTVYEFQIWRIIDVKLFFFDLVYSFFIKNSTYMQFAFKMPTGHIAYQFSESSSLEQHAIVFIDFAILHDSIMMWILYYYL